MKIQCPRCRQVVPADQVNVAKDLAFCPDCNDGFSVSSILELGSVDRELLWDPPGGAWFVEDVERVMVGATTRSWAALLLVPFMCVWSGVSLAGIYGSQVVSGSFNLPLSVFGIPFILGSILFWAFTLMTICGKVEVSIGTTSHVFVGVGGIGWKRQFDWSAVRDIRENATLFHYPGSHNAAIVLEGRTRLSFGTGLNESRRYFVLQALKMLKAQRR